jgi:dynein heavy chain
MVAAIQDFITLHLGSEFIDPPTFDLSSSFKDSSVSTPLIFILSPGTDPANDFLKFAEEMKFGKKYDMVSLGQGQVNYSL